MRPSVILSKVVANGLEFKKIYHFPQMLFTTTIFNNKSRVLSVFLISNNSMFNFSIETVMFLYYTEIATYILLLLGH